MRLLRHAGGKLNEQKAQALFFALDTANVGHISFGIHLIICSYVFTVLNCIFSLCLIDSFAQYTEKHAGYKFLYHKSEHIRRPKSNVVKAAKAAETSN